MYGSPSVSSRELGYLERALHERIAPCVPADPCSPGTTRPLQVIDQFEYIAILSWLVDSWQQWAYINSIIVLFLYCLRSLQVCRTWHQQISPNIHLMEKVTAYRRLCKESAENLEKVYKAIPVMAVGPTPRRALATIVPNVMLQSRSTKPAPFPQKLAQRAMQKHRPCPNCQSPAKELNLRRAQCSKCQFDFCQHCFKPWHEGECRGRMSPGKRPRQSESLCCTKKSKKRLHRL